MALLLVTISYLLIFNQTTTYFRKQHKRFKISYLLIFNQTTTISSFRILSFLISYLLIFNQTTTQELLLGLSPKISCLLIFNQTTTENYHIPAGGCHPFQLWFEPFKTSKNLCQRTLRNLAFQ